jgi:hypothetical protein
MRRWCIIQDPKVTSQLEGMAKEWGKRGACPPALDWFPSVSQQLISSAPDDQNGVDAGLILNLSGDVIETSFSCTRTEPG